MNTSIGASLFNTAPSSGNVTSGRQIQAGVPSRSARDMAGSRQLKADKSFVRELDQASMEDTTSLDSVPETTTDAVVIENVSNTQSDGDASPEQDEHMAIADMSVEAEEKTDDVTIPQPEQYVVVQSLPMAELASYFKVTDFKTADTSSVSVQGVADVGELNPIGRETIQTIDVSGSVKAELGSVSVAIESNSQEAGIAVQELQQPVNASQQAVFDDQQQFKWDAESKLSPAEMVQQNSLSNSYMDNSVTGQTEVIKSQPQMPGMTTANSVEALLRPVQPVASVEQINGSMDHIDQAISSEQQLLEVLSGQRVYARPVISDNYHSEAVVQGSTGGFTGEVVSQVNESMIPSPGSIPVGVLAGEQAGIPIEETSGFMPNMVVQQDISTQMTNSKQVSELALGTHQVEQTVSAMVQEKTSVLVGDSVDEVQPAAGQLQKIDVGLGAISQNMQEQPNHQSAQENSSGNMSWEQNQPAEIKNMEMTVDDNEARQPVVSNKGEAQTQVLDSQGRVQLQQLPGEVAFDVAPIPQHTTEVSSSQGEVESLAVPLPGLQTVSETVNSLDAQMPANGPNDYNVPKQIVEQARLIRANENTEMVIKLNPEHLGELTLRVSVKGDSGITASFYTDNAQTRAILETSLVQLRQELNDQGFKVDSVEVHTGLTDGQLPEGQSQGQYQQQQQNIRSTQADLKAFEDDADRFSAEPQGSMPEVIRDSEGNEISSGVDYTV